MAININNLGSNQALKNNVHKQEQAQQNSVQKAATSDQAKNVAKDSVSITPQARQLGELQKKAVDEPVINQKKIDALKKAITSGDYKINPEKLAANISAFEFKLNSK